MINISLELAPQPFVYASMRVKCGKGQACVAAASVLRAAIRLQLLACRSTNLSRTSTFFLAFADAAGIRTLRTRGGGLSHHYSRAPSNEGEEGSFSASLLFRVDG